MRSRLTRGFSCVCACQHTGCTQSQSAKSVTSFVLQSFLLLLFSGTVQCWFVAPAALPCWFVTHRMAVSCGASTHRFWPTVSAKAMQRRLAFSKSLALTGSAEVPQHVSSGPTFKSQDVSRAKKHWLTIASRVLRSNTAKLALAVTTRMSRTRVEHERLQRVAALYSMTRLRHYSRLFRSSWQ